MGSTQVLDAGQLGRGNGLSLGGRQVGIVLVAAVSSSAAAPSRGFAASLDGTGDHPGPSELIDPGHTKVGNPVQAKIEGLDVGNILVGGLGDEVRPQGSRKTRHTDLEVVLEDLIGRPSVLSGFGKVDVLSVRQNLALSAVQGPNEDDFVLGSTAVGSRFPVGDGRGIGDTKLEGDLLFGEPKGLGSVFDTVVDLVGAEDVRHVCVIVPCAKAKRTTVESIDRLGDTNFARLICH